MALESKPGGCCRGSHERTEGSCHQDVRLASTKGADESRNGIRSSCAVKAFEKYPVID
jgi:hypothetical protein